MTNLITINTHNCMGCKSCELSCAVSHSESKSLFQAIHEIPQPVPRIFVETLSNICVPMQCRHCESPPCAQVCPTGAITKESSLEPVLIKHDKCIGCKYCLIACPFGVLVLRSADHNLIKCDLCTDIKAKGEPPNCVESCPTQALSFVTSQELAQQKRREFMVEFTSRG